MNRNRKLRKQMMSGLAVGMAAVMGAAPVYAATGEDAAVSKEETVYVNANADGSEDQITVSNWLKNAGTEKNLKDESELKDIKNVKGDEEFTQSGNELTWQTDGEDIYYQGTTTKEPPVSVKFTYYLDGKEIKPDDLAGKSGKLKIKVDYTNNTKTTVDINGKKETMYTPFVLMTGMILPQDTFSNVKIDNGKVISDGSRNIVIGFGMPGLQESLGLNSDSLEDLVSGDSDFELPESLEITADVENFSLDSTFTVALDDVLDTINTDNITGYDDLKDALSDLEDAAMELVDGSKALSDGVDTLKDSYKELDDGIGTLKDGADELNSGAGTLVSGAGTLASGASTLANGTSTLNSGASTLNSGAATLSNGASTLSSGASSLASGVNSYTEGADTLNKAIQTYLGKNGVLTGSVTEYVNGVNKVVAGVKQYTDGTTQLSDGVASYVAGEKQLAAGAEQLQPLADGLTEVNSAIATLNAALDGKDENDILAGAKQLSEGLTSLNEQLQSTDVQSLLTMIDGMTSTGSTLISETEALSEVLNTTIAGSVNSMMTNGNELMSQMDTLSKGLESYLLY